MIIKRMRICSRGMYIDLILLLLLVFLLFTFFHQYRNMHNKNSNNVDGQEEIGSEIRPGRLRTMREVEQLLRIEKTEGLRDVRSDDCRGRSYMRGIDKVAVVIHFSDYEFFDVRNTLSSCVRGNGELVGELVVVDDGSNLGHIAQQAKQYFSNMRPIVKYIRSESHEGAAKSRSLALSLVSLELVVFLDASVICSPGWLAPLVHTLLTHNDRDRLFVLPHHDRILHPASLDYEPLEYRSRATLTWNLAVKMLPSSDKVNPDGSYRSTVMRGNVFAVTKTLIEQLGGFDTELDEGGGESLELSMRGWMCGAVILTNPCSRVGIINLNQIILISSGPNMQRIANMWFGSGAAPILTLAGSSDLAHPLDQSESRNVQTRLEKLFGTLKCKDINWFLKEVAGFTIFPSQDVFKFGKLRAASDAVTRVGADSRLELVNMPDPAATTSSRFIFELTKGGALMSGGRCVTALKNLQVILEDCRSDDRQQKWNYKDWMLSNVWSNLCFTHVTDPDDSKANRQIVMIQSCNSGKQDDEKFKKWYFVDV